MMRWKRMGAALSVLAVIAGGIPAIAVEPTKRVDMRVLLVVQDGDAESGDAWKTILDREGTPYDVFSPAGPDLTSGDLEAAPGHARYQAIICVPDCLAPSIPDSDDLTDGETVRLAEYQSEYGIRRLNTYAWPQPSLGLDWGGTGASLDGAKVDLTPAGRDVFPYLKGSFALDSGTWGYPATANPPDPYTSLITDKEGKSLVGIHANPAGYEEMNISWASNPWQLQTFAIGHGALSWVTGGTYLGYSRNYFTMHIDDVFLPDDRWDTTTNSTPEPSPNPIRMTPDDVARALAWQDENGIVMDFVYNAAGSVEAGGAGVDPLTKALLPNWGKFRWINHTYSHLNLQSVNEETILAEIVDNLAWAQDHGVPVDATELVTGEHSGLADRFGAPENPSLAPALAAAGVRWIASDNSVNASQYGVGASALTVPRYPSNVYYNVGTLEEQLDEYNYIYFDNCSDTAVTTCLPSPATWEQYVDSEARIMLPHLLGNDLRPHYFHQANLAEEGTLYPVVDEVLSRYRDLTSLPLVQPTFSEAGEAMRRMDRWLKGRDGVTAYLEGGEVHLGATEPIEVPVTGSSAVGEMYGNQMSGWVVVDGPVPTTSTTTSTTIPDPSSTTTSTTALDPSSTTTSTTAPDPSSTTTSTTAPDPSSTTTSTTAPDPSSTTTSTTSTSTTSTSTTVPGPSTTTSTPPGGSQGGTRVGGIRVGSGRFVDDDGHVHEWAIDRLAGLGVTRGCDVAGEFFCPDRPATREEAAVILWRAFGAKAAPFAGVFRDVLFGDWSAAAVEWLVGRGAVVGFGDGTFRGSEPMTRAQGAAVLARTFSLTPGMGGPFGDVAESAWYAPFVNRLAADGVTAGCSVSPPRYCPEEPLTRADLAAMIARALDR